VKIAPLPPNESQRLDALHRYGVLGSAPEAAFDELTRLAAQICGTPVSLITLLDDSRQWFKSRFGFGATETPRDFSFCGHTILQHDIMVVEDASRDDRFADNPLVSGDAAIRFYAGVPLVTPEGFALGTLCVLDRAPRQLAPEQVEALRTLARQVMTQLELRRHLDEMARNVERHQATEQRLRISEAFYQTLVETLPQNILRKDLQGRFTFANRRFCQAIGKRLEEILGKTDFDLFPAELAAKYHRDDLRVTTTLENLDTVEAHQGPHGEKLFVHVIKSPLYDAAGKVIGIQGIFWDVTQRKRIEEELAYERDLLRALLDHIPDRIYFKDVYCRFMRCSKSMARRLGLADPREVVGKTDFDFHSPEQAQEFFNDEQRILLTGEPLINKLEKQHDTEGNEIWASVTKVPIYTQGGTIAGLVGLSRDITQLKQTERALRQAEEKYRAIYENSVEGIFQTTRDGHFLSANPSLARMYGYNSPEEVVAALTDIEHQLYVDPERRTEFSRLMRERGEVSGFESQIYRKDKSVIWISESARTVKDPAGGILYYEGIVEDISARKQAELERERAREAALESARTKAQFLANMSHEIRTPMNAITGMTGLLADTRLTKEQREYVETIGNSTETLLSVINDILDFSKIEARKLTLEVIDFDLQDAVESSVELLAERAHKKNIELSCWIEPGVPNRLRGDPVRFRQILTNLVSNAVKFTEKGEVLVRVSRLEEDAHRLVARFEVKDTGIGIAPEALSRIFQEFTQVDGTTTRKYGGTGLGLTISKQLVSLLQGEIGVDSKPGEGSTFWIQLPFEKQPEAESPPLPAPSESLAGLRVLVVDDTVTTRQILHQHLHDWSIADDHAVSTAEALTMIQDAAKAGNPYLLLIIDLDMPETDGLALAQTIKNDPQLATSRIIMLTTLLNRLNTTTMKATGISACLVKPIRQSRLLECLIDAMSPSGAVTSQPSDPDHLPVRPALSRALARGVRVLLAEDNVVNQRVALKQLKKLGFSADSVSNGNEVLSALQRVPYDIIIMDCQMPEMDGYEVTRRIRQSGSDSYIHLKSAPYIIALTANAMRGDRERCLTIGMNDYLTKPLHLHELEAVLQRALLRIQPAAFSPEPMPKSEPEPAALDRSVIDGLKELREPGQPDPLRELIDLFFKDAEPRLRMMEEALVASDLSGVAAAAHTLKGSASNLGARRLASLCAALEKLGKSSEGAKASKTLVEIKSEFAKVRGLLSIEMEN
jgi:two-component system sensor histidine kinase/response regulator